VRTVADPSIKHLIVSQPEIEPTTIRSLSPAPCRYITEPPYSEYTATLQKN